MPSDERVVVEIAFDGGQIMGARLTTASADELEQALAARNDGALTLDADDGRYTIPLGRVVYVKRFTREARLGFSSGSQGDNRAPPSKRVRFKQPGLAAAPAKPPRPLVGIASDTSVPGLRETRRGASLARWQMKPPPRRH